MFQIFRRVDLFQTLIWIISNYDKCEQKLRNVMARGTTRVFLILHTFSLLAKLVEFN